MTQNSIELDGNKFSSTEISDNNDTNLSFGDIFDSIKAKTFDEVCEENEQETMLLIENIDELTKYLDNLEYKLKEYNQKRLELINELTEDCNLFSEQKDPSSDANQRIDSEEQQNKLENP